MPEPRSVDRHLVAARVARDRSRQHERRVVGCVGVQLSGHRLGLVEQLGDVDAGQAGRDQPEGGQGAVAAADVGVGEEDLAVALLGGQLLEVGARVGDGHDPRGGVDARLLERLDEDAALAVGLERPAGLARHDDDRRREVAADRATDDMRVGRVEDRQRHVVACARSPRVPGTSHPCRRARPGRGPRTTAAPAARRSRRAAAATWWAGRPTTAGSRPRTRRPAPRAWRPGQPACLPPCRRRAEPPARRTPPRW